MNELIICRRIDHVGSPWLQEWPQLLRERFHQFYQSGLGGDFVFPLNSVDFESFCAKASRMHIIFAQYRIIKVSPSKLLNESYYYLTTKSISIPSAIDSFDLKKGCQSERPFICHIGAPQVRPLSIGNNLVMKNRYSIFHASEVLSPSTVFLASFRFKAMFEKERFSGAEFIPCIVSCDNRKADHAPTNPSESLFQMKVNSRLSTVVKCNGLNYVRICEKCGSVNGLGISSPIVNAEFVFGIGDIASVNFVVFEDEVIRPLAFPFEIVSGRLLRELFRLEHSGIVNYLNDPKVHIRKFP